MLHIPIWLFVADLLLFVLVAFVVYKVGIGVGIEANHKMRQHEMRQRNAALIWWDSDSGALALSFAEGATVSQIEQLRSHISGGPNGTGGMRSPMEEMDDLASRLHLPFEGK